MSYHAGSIIGCDTAPNNHLAVTIGVDREYTTCSAHVPVNVVFAYIEAVFIQYLLLHV